MAVITAAKIPMQSEGSFGRKGRKPLGKKFLQEDFQGDILPPPPPREDWEGFPSWKVCPVPVWKHGGRGSIPRRGEEKYIENSEKLTEN